MRALEQVLEIAGAGERMVYMTDRAGRVRFANETAKKLFGIKSLKELSGQRQWTSASRIGRYVREVEVEFRRNHQVEIHENAVESPEAGAFSLSYRKLRDESGALLGVACIGQPLTDEVTGADFETMKTIMDSLPDIVFFKNVAGKFVAANRATAKMMKARDAVDLIGKTDFDFYPKDLAQSYRKDELEFFHVGEPQIIEQPVWREDGSRGHMCALKVPVRDANNVIIGYVGHGRDITETREAEHRLRHREGELEEAQLLAGMGSLGWISGKTVVGVSAGLLRLIGEDGEAQATSIRRLLRLVHYPDRKPLVSAVRAVLATGNKQELIFRFTRRGGGPICFVEATFRLSNSFEGKPLVFGALHDITSARQVQQHLEEIAYKDSLTGISNRAAFFERGEKICKDCADSDDQLVSILLIDLDGFKEVNDTHGHAAGDALLCEVASRLKAIVRPGDLVARLGGDEFTVLLQHGPNSDLPETIASLCVNTLRLPVVLETGTVSVSASVGIASPISKGESVDHALARADRALYSVKSRGRDGFAFANRAMVSNSRQITAHRAHARDSNVG